MYKSIIHFFSRFSIRVLSIIILSVIFALSAWSKLQDIVGTEMLIYSSGFVPWKLTEFAARSVIVLEFGLSFWLTTSFFLKDRTSLVVTFITLAIFQIFLFFQLVLDGNQDNCGCFGNMIEMSTGNSFIKNFVLMFLAWFSYKGFDEEPIISRSLRLIIPLLGITFFAITIMVFNPINNIFYSPDSGNVQSIAFNKSKLDTLKINELAQDGTLITLVSPDCSHCIKFTGKLNELQRSNTFKNAHLIIYGDKESIDHFTRSTSNELPLHVIEKRAHFKLTPGFVPAIYYYKNDSIYGPWGGGNFDPEIIKKYPTVISPLRSH